MAKRLISFLIKKTGWKLLGKAALAAVGLWFLIWAGFSFWPILIFFIAILTVYFSESPERQRLRSSFWLLSLFSLLGAEAISALPGFSWDGLMNFFLIVVYGLLVFGILGLLNLFFRNRFLVYNLLHTALLAYFFLLIFYLAPGWPGSDWSGGNIFWLIVWFLALFWGAALLIKEALVFEKLARGRNLRITAWSAALLIAEIAIFTALLPLGFVNAAALLTLFSILGRDLLLARLRGSLNLALVFKELTIFAVVLTLIFATVNWVLP